MVALPLKSSCTEQHAIVHFCGLKDNANAIHREMRLVYGDKCFTRLAIHAWSKKFACGIENSDNKKRCGRHVVATTDATIATINEFIRSE